MLHRVLIPRFFCCVYVQTSPCRWSVVFLGLVELGSGQLWHPLCPLHADLGKWQGLLHLGFSSVLTVNAGQAMTFLSWSLGVHCQATSTLFLCVANWSRLILLLSQESWLIPPPCLSHCPFCLCKTSPWVWHYRWPINKSTGDTCAMLFFPFKNDSISFNFLF